MYHLMPRLRKSYVRFSIYSGFCIFNHPMIYQICDAMISIGIWDKVHFRLYLLNHNSLSHQTWSIDRYKQMSMYIWIYICVYIDKQICFSQSFCFSKPTMLPMIIMGLMMTISFVVTFTEKNALAHFQLVKGVGFHNHKPWHTKITIRY